MPATPTTKSQVQAYRFVLKRMESALVRRDAVMLHDPMRTHLRASVVGFALALLLALGFLVYGFIKPRQALGDTDEILLVKQTGQVFVHVNNPTKRLIPVQNLTSARLILIRQAGGAGAVANARPRQVDDSVIKDVPREPLAGIPGAPGDVPVAGNLADTKWSVCDTTEQDPRLPDSSRIADPARFTTVLAGIDGPGRALAGAQALLARASSGDYYLVYEGKRAKIDVRNSALLRAFNVVEAPGDLMRDERPVSDGLLNAIPEVPELVSPVQELGGRSPFPELGTLEIGAVVQVNRVGAVDYYLIRPDGVQRVPQSVAELVRFTATDGDEIPVVTPEAIRAAPELDGAVDTSDFPAAVPTIVPVVDSKVACLNWTVAEGRQVTTITIGGGMTLPSGQRPVSLASRDGKGEGVDEFFMPTGRGAAVQGVVPDQVIGTGTIFLVNDQGVKFGVPNWGGRSSVDLANALGMTDRRPAPEAVLRLLPIGPPLDPDQAVRTFDVVPLTDGGGGVLPLPDGSLPPAPVDETAPADGAGGTENGGTGGG